METPQSIDSRDYDSELISFEFVASEIKVILSTDRSFKDYT